MNISGKIQELILGLILIIFGLVTFPTLNGYVEAAVANATAGSLAAVFLPFVPWIWVIVILMIALAIMADAARRKS